MKHCLNNKGQAVFEFLIFMPFLVILYSIIYNVGNSINASINQQKATRSYYYGITKGNSFIFSSSEIKEYKDGGMRVMGLSSVAWRQRSEGSDGGISFAPCYTFNGLIKSGVNDDCDKRDPGDASRHIRVFTAYGVCGPSFINNGSSVYIDPVTMSDPFSCKLQK